MPTTITSSVGSGAGRAFATYAAWKAYVEGRGSGSIVAADEFHIAELYPDSVFTETAFACPATTTDATHGVIVRCAAGKSFNANGAKLTNALRYNEANGVAMRLSSATSNTFTCSATNVTIDGIQFLSTGAHTAAFFGAFGGTLQNCIVDLGTATASTSAMVSNMASSGSFKNCAFVGAIAARPWAATTTANAAVFDACDFYKTVTSTIVAVQTSTSGRATFRNCTFFGQGTQNLTTSIASGPTFTTNATDGALNYGTGVGSVTAANNFQNVVSAATLDLRAKAGGAIVGAGTNNLTTDILGQSRQNPPTIGAHEFYASTPVAYSTPVIVRRSPLLAQPKDSILSPLAVQLGFSVILNYAEGIYPTNAVTARGIIATSTGDQTLASGPGGIAANFPGNNGNAQTLLNNPLSTSVCSYLWVDSGPGGILTTSRYDGTANSGLQMRSYGNDIQIITSNIAVILQATGVRSTTGVNTFATSVAGDYGRHAIFGGGRLLAQTPNPNVQYTHTTSGIGDQGPNGVSGGNLPFNGRLYLLAFAPRVVPDDYLAMLTLNPWLLFAPIVRRILAPVAPAVGPSAVYRFPGILLGILNQ